jgi:FkbM family methyltransferase
MKRWMDMLPKRVKRSILWALRPDYRYRLREISRLKALQRYQPTTTGLLGQVIHVIDAASFLSAYEQIFEGGIYDFPASGEDPRIIDCGANIGLAVLFWKRRYPRSRILAFEPDPAAFEALVTNCHNWRLTEVECINKAVWSEEGECLFVRDGADAGHLLLGEGDEGEGAPVPVCTVRLRDYLEEPVELLKLDIEGAEAEVLADCSDALERVERVFVEYHSRVHREQRLDTVTHVLRSAGYRIHIQPGLVSKQPFLRTPESYGMDQRLNIFAYRLRSPAGIPPRG